MIAKIINKIIGITCAIVAMLFIHVLVLTPFKTKKTTPHNKIEAAIIAGQVVPLPKKLKRVKPPNAEKITVR